jgi:hypothetical protein
MTRRWPAPSRPKPSPSSRRGETVRWKRSRTVLSAFALGPVQRLDERGDAQDVAEQDELLAGVVTCLADDGEDLVAASRSSIVGSMSRMIRRWRSRR